MVTPHINAENGAFAEAILLPGDPLRAKFIADTFFSNVKEVTNVRNILGFTGTYKDKRVSVMGTGMGIPSISIYAKELITEYNVKSLIRVGSSGSIADHLALGDIVVGVGASTDSGVNRSRFFDADFSATASWNLLHNFVHTAEKLNKNVHVGNIFSGDLFYDPRKETFEVMKQMGILAVEMEAAGLYGVAAEYDANALAVATVSDVISKNLQMSSEEREIGLKTMVEITLDSL
ncbi:MAG: purine-nucleoside phosphorylase [Candidatus Actinomarina sp.]|jgi:purine-nucleoside phosphorylase|tara:strand:- start:2027 stop:2728 length:702 start_codon:yes stop_codon:yes gene_type:complete